MYLNKAMLHSTYPIYNIIIMWLYLSICIYVETASSTNDLDELLTTDFHCIHLRFLGMERGRIHG